MLLDCANLGLQLSDLGPELLDGGRISRRHRIGQTLLSPMQVALRVDALTPQCLGDVAAKHQIAFGEALQERPARDRSSIAKASS